MNRSVLSVVVAFLVLLVALLCGGPWMRAMTVTSAGLDQALAAADEARVRDALDQMDPDTRAQVTDRCALEVLRCTPATCGIDVDDLAGRSPTTAERRKLTELVDRCVQRQEAAAARGVRVVQGVVDDEDPPAAGTGELPLWLTAVGALGSCVTCAVMLGMVAATLLGRGAAR